MRLVYEYNFWIILGGIFVLPIESRNRFGFYGSLLTIFVLYDSYYYWMHRLVSRYGERFHRLHHTGRPRAFHHGCVESLATVFPYFPFVYCGFSHDAINLWVGITILWAFWGHSIIRPLPIWLRGIFLTSVQHLEHHRDSSKYFGAYFTFWDRIMRTTNGI